MTFCFLLVLNVKEWNVWLQCMEKTLDGLGAKICSLICLLHPQVSLSYAACTRQAAIPTGSQLVSWLYDVNHRATSVTQELVHRGTRKGEQIHVMLKATLGMKTPLPTLEHQWKCTGVGDEIYSSTRLVFVDLHAMIGWSLLTKLLEHL